ncbi:unnamed protein product [Acanthoscelides obtectus]|uniref:RRM domain-containing protein n=1 Tax=Acanthoscelides obtectus TaxID=200917 RepID=A0A9P0PC06_ACAOB|nr:unnamed protein product [Acanthoscelides obtectus]CAK1626160.1 Squamous cell carcinoma antigen recognized by T-cells 3 [Acanthoscelides obtectus]
MSDEEKDMDANMSDEQGNSNTESSSDDEDKELMAKVEELEKQISANKYLYDAHLELVELYRKLGDLNSLRESYERFHECFPLTPKIWLDWIRDEIKIASSEEEKKRVFQIFDKAVEDYLSVELWTEYAQYSIGVSNLETTRSIIERGLTCAGLHASEGHLLWDTLRELENAHISLQEKGSAAWTAQVKRLGDIFKRQLSVPLMNIENTYEEWQQWHKTLPDGLYDPKPVEWGYKKARKILGDYKPFEERLLIAQTEEFDVIYREYIKIVKDPSTVICLYERAVLPLCLSPNIWAQYCAYVIKLGDAALKVSDRALRNCPWSEELWIWKLRVMEWLQRDNKEELSCFEQALQSLSPSPCLDLWLSYLEYSRRNEKDGAKLEKLFSDAVERLWEHDAQRKIARFHARLLAKKENMQAARKIWSGILGDATNKGLATAWLEFANLERQYGEVNQVRSIYKRALSACTEWQQAIVDDWLMFERENGTLEDVLKCVETCKSLVKVYAQTYSNQNNQSNDDTRMDTSDVKKGTKRKQHREEIGQKKRMKPDKTHEDKSPQQKRLEKDPKTTVFVSNLHSSVKEKQLKELFPNATEVEVAYDKKGRSRCYGYIKFAKEEEAMTALASDRIPLDGRPVFISELKPAKMERKPAFKYSTTVENNKLFVKGLPVTKTKEEVEELFKPHKAIDVRVILKKSGQSKGLAYVEFANEADAQKALKATDGMKVDDHEISVAISAPPPKKEKKPEVPEPSRHARSRLQVPLIPRSLQVKSATEKSGSTNGNAAVSTAAPKSNADFRNMLLKK